VLASGPLQLSFSAWFKPLVTPLVTTRRSIVADNSTCYNCQDAYQPDFGDCFQAVRWWVEEEKKYLTSTKNKVIKVSAMLDRLSQRKRAQVKLIATWTKSCIHEGPEPLPESLQ